MRIRRIVDLLDTRRPSAASAQLPGRGRRVKSEDEHWIIIITALCPKPQAQRPRQAPSRNVHRFGSYARDAAVSRRQAPVSRRDRVLPDGRLLRDVLRGRAGRVARARTDADVALEGCRRPGHPDVRRPLSCGRRLYRPAREEGLSRRDLRAGRGSAEGQGTGPARGRARRLTGHADRAGISRRARTGVPHGHRRRRATGWSVSRSWTSRPASSRRPSIAARGTAGADRRDRRPAPA